ncbi:hypothetical protein BV898_18864 [Hypsibius exemplaris]|uniref:Uncharacterized protein n=1 Tax=Hypsibius exemplaris TaxID=2072580 RepID=A0A9X6NI25_HYPEX|nr:hypothetical protein BV898_18864 [Hypsibius exemplaris]
MMATQHADYPAVHKRSLRRRYDPEDEIAMLRKKVDEERARRRQLEQDLYKLQLERHEMCIKMSKMESTKVTATVPACMMPLLVDAMAKGLDPAKLRPQTSVRLTPQQSQQLRVQKPVSTAKPAQPKQTTPTKLVYQPRSSTAPARGGATRGRPRGSGAASRATALNGVRPTAPSTSAQASTSAGIPSAEAAPAGGDAQQYVIQTREANGQTITFLVPLQPGQAIEPGNAVSVVNMTNQPISAQQAVVDLTAAAPSPRKKAPAVDNVAALLAEEGDAGQLTLASAANTGGPIPDTPASPVPAAAVLDEESDFVDMES